jgi:preprotein translocase subunit SecG
MFTIFVVIVHVVVCVALILIILLQSGKGADIGAVFGGGSSQTVFGSGGASTFLGKVTVGAAVTFMLTSIILTYFSGRVTSSLDSSVMKSGAAPISRPEATMPVGEPPAAAKEGPSAPAAGTPGVTAPAEKSQAPTPEASGPAKGSDFQKSESKGEEPR